ncbi:DUF6503 family protein [Psychroserpens sp. MEBiC05023]
MKLKSLFLIVVFTFISCKDNKIQETVDSIDYSEEALDVTTSTYPETITKVFDAHGGIDKWNTMNTLSFTMEKPNGKEVTTTHLKTRAERIDTPTYTSGYDGQTLWVKEKDGIEYKGNAKFYKGLMMYFYAMPFIVGDDGIIYEEAQSLEFDGKTYPGLLISYEAGVGESPDDQYIIYYDADTGKMEWLAYTVTFGKEGKSKDFRYIRYHNWETINGLQLPKSIKWYTVENNLPIKERNTVEFTNIMLSEKTPDSTLFSIPEGASIIE